MKSPKIDIRLLDVNIEWLLENRAQIHLDPPFQRHSAIWPEKTKALLIDTVLNRFDIPKFYFADAKFLSSGQPRDGFEVVDGKQRCEAIWKFLDGELALPEDFILLEDSSRNIAGNSFGDLKNHHPDLAARVLSYPLTVMSVTATDEAMINQIFIRLNAGYALTGSERRQALDGPVPDLISKIVAHRFFGEWIAFSTRRSQDKNLAAKLLLLEHSGEIAGTGKTRLDRFVESHAKDAQVTRTNADLEALPQDDEDDLIQAIDDANLQSESGFPPPSTNDLLESSFDRVCGVLEQMCEGFKPKSTALALSANIPVFYWLFRENAGSNPSDIAKFLEEFTGELREFLKVISKTPIGEAVDVQDPQLALYYTYQRTSNDKRSIAGRFEILQGRLDES